MRFLFHFYDLHQRAGIQRAIVELSNALVEEGHEVIVAVSTPPTGAAYLLDERVVVEDTSNPELLKFGMMAWPGRAAWALRALPILRGLVRRHNPSIVVDHGTALGLLYPFASIGGVPFVLQRHFPVRGFPHGKLLHRLQSIASRSRTIVALTEAIAAEMRTQGHRNVTVIPNVLPAGAHPAPYKDAIPRSALLMGRAKNPQKGFDLFLQALAVAKLEGWHFQIVGPEVDSDSQLLALVREHRLEGEVDLLPGNADPYLLLRNCSCLIMPSRYEGFPLVALEALSIGRPVLASDVDGLRDLVIPGTNGMLFHAEDVAELSAALEFVEKNPEQLGYFASNASESVKQYRGPIVVAKWCALVTRLTEQFNLREAHSSGPGSAEQTAAQGGSDG